MNNFLKKCIITTIRLVKSYNVLQNITYWIHINFGKIEILKQISQYERSTKSISFIKFAAAPEIHRDCGSTWEMLFQYHLKFLIFYIRPRILYSVHFSNCAYDKNTYQITYWKKYISTLSFMIIELVRSR